MFFKNKLTLINKSTHLIDHLFKTFFNTFEMNINNIFDLFDDNNPEQKSEDDISLLVDFSEHPFYWIGGFNKIIANHSYFQKYAIEVVKGTSLEKNEEEINITGDKLMFEKAWGYICNINLTNPFHVECLGKKSSFEFIKNLKLSIQHFEQYEEYEKCALLKGIESKIKYFLK